MSGDYEFQFIYDETICGNLNDFIIYDLSNLTQGFDNPDDDDLAIYPSNIDVTIDDDTRLNFLKFETLKKSYTKTYPFNFEDVFYLKLYRNGEYWFKGILQNCSQGVRGFSVTLNFVDGINKTKEISLGNPYILHYLYENNFINRVSNGSDPSNATYFCYGYKTVISNISGHFLCAKGIENDTADKNVNLKSIIIGLFKLLNINVTVDFQNQFYFRNAENQIYEVEIDEVFVKRVCSVLYGRFICVRNDLYNLFKDDEDAEYQDPKYYEVVYNDGTWTTYYHNWEGNFPEGISTKVHHKGVNERKLNDFLKFVARNLFSYFNFVGINNVKWQHKRFISSPVILSRILDIDADTTIKGVNSVTVKGLNNKNQHTEGIIYEGTDNQNLQISIPFTVEATENSYESWLYFIANNTEEQIVKVRDGQTGFTEFIQKVIAKNEYDLKSPDRKKIIVEVEGVDYKFSDTYYAKHENVEYIFRPIMMEKDLKMDTTKITGVEIGI